MRALALAAAVTIAALPLSAQNRDAGGGSCTANVYNCAETINPLPPANTVWIEEMTWMDLRDAIKSGKTTVIIGTGGMEPNGPWLASGKHNYVLRANCDAIARQLGNALCAPIVKLVPEGNIEPPSGHMTSPNTLSLREATYRAQLADLAASLKAQGFKHIILIGDSGGNTGGMTWLADSANTAWRGSAMVTFVPQHYSSYSPTGRHMESKGIVDGQSDNLHDDAIISLNMFYTDPNSIRYDQRVKLGLATINGVSIMDRQKTLEWAREVVRYRADTTVKVIKVAAANGGVIPAPPGGGRGRAGAAGDSAGGRAGGGGRGRGAAGDSAAAGGRGRGGRGGAADSTGRAGGGGGGGRAGAAAGDTTGRGGRGGGGGRGGATAAPGMRAGAGWGWKPVRPDSAMTMGGGTCGPYKTPKAGVRPDTTQPRGGNVWNCAGTPNPAPETWSVWMEEISWMGVRDYLKAGRHTMIIPVGGVEPAGPWLATGRSNYMLKANCDRIARTLGTALCSSIIDLTPVTSANITEPGRIGVSERTFRNILQDVIHAQRTHGWRNLVVISESPAAEPAIRSLVDSLNTAWKATNRVVYVPEYMASASAAATALRTAGVIKAGAKADGFKDDPVTTLNVIAAKPTAARIGERMMTRQTTIDGVDLSDLAKTMAWAKTVADTRATRTVTAIRAKLAAPAR
jgi:creatinine amidohydrolase